MDFPSVELPDRKMDVQVVITRNRNAYARVSGGSIVISLPRSLRSEQANKVASGLYERIRKSILKRPERYIYDKKEDIKFHDGQVTRILGREINFHISSSSGKASRAKMVGNDIYIKVPDALDPIQKEKATSHIARRLLTRELKDEISARLGDINSRYFKSDIRQIKLANASSRWGSCSTSRGIGGAKIMLNFKLLFMPQECLEYVMVHELAHTKVQGHSDRFWRIVSGILPDYKQRIKLLRESAYGLKTANSGNIIA